MQPNQHPKRVASLQFSLVDFAHCQQLADYIARLAAAKSFDIERQTTLLAMHTNECLELTYILGTEPGEISLEINTSESTTNLQLTIPSNEERWRQYQEALRPALSYKADKASRGLDWLRNDQVGGGIFELVSVFGDGLALTRQGDALQVELVIHHEQAQ
jgi:hypothetical protein